MFFSDRVPIRARDAYKKDAVAGVLAAIMSGITFPFVAVIARKTLHASALEISFLMMAPVAGHLLSLVWANIMQGRRKSPFAVWSWAISRALLFFVVFATNSIVFIGLIVLFYVIGSIASPAYSDIMREVYPDGDRAKIMGFVRVLVMVAGIVLTLIAGKLLECVSYRWVFPVAAVFGVASALVFGQIHAKERTGNPEVRLHHFVADSIRILVVDKGYLWFCLGVFIFGFANFMAITSYAIYEVDVLKAYEFRQSIYTLVGSAVAMIAYFYWGGYLDRRRPEKVIAMQAFAWAFIPLSYVVASQWWMVLPAKALAGFLNAGIDLVYLIGVLHFAPPERVSQYQAVFLTLMGIRGMVAPFLGGALIEWNILSFHAIFMLSAVLIFVSVVVQIIGYKKYHSLTLDQEGDCAI